MRGALSTSGHISNPVSARAERTRIMMILLIHAFSLDDRLIVD